MTRSFGNLRLCEIGRRLAVGFLLFSGAVLEAQSYQTSFASQNYDRAKAPVGFDAGIAKVDPASGSVDLRIPIGPGIGARGLHWVPTYTARIAPGIQMVPNYSSVQGVYYAPKAELSKDRSVHSGCRLGLPGNEEPFAYALPDGRTGSANPDRNMSSALFAPSDVRGVLTAFGYGSDVVASAAPSVNLALTASPISATNPWILRGSAGELIMGIYSPVSGGWADIKVFPSYTVNKEYFHYPKRILVIRGDIAYEYEGGAISTERAVVIENATPPNEPKEIYAMKVKNVSYSLRRMMNRFGESIEFESYVAGTIDTFDCDGKTTPTQLGGRKAIWKGIDGTKQIRIEEMKEFQSTPQPAPLDPICSVVSAGNRYIYEMGGEPLSYLLKGGELTCESTGEKVAWGMGKGPSITSGNTTAEPWNLQWIKMPGRQINFTWSRYTYRMNGVPVSGVWGGYSGEPNGPDPNNLNTTYSDGVSRIDDVDTQTGTTRTTTYTRTVPTPRWETMSSWADIKFYVATKHPDGRTTVQYFVEPINTGKAGNGSDGSSTDDQFQTLAHLKHVVREVREYASGVDWATDVTAPAASSSAYRVVIYDRFDIRGIGNSETTPLISTAFQSVPYPTRTRSYDREKNVMVVDEQTDWDTTNFAWKTHHKSVVTSGFDYTSQWTSAALQGIPFTEPSGSVYSETTNRTYSSDRGQWLFARIKTEQTVVNFDNSGGSSQSSGGALPMKARTYDKDAGMAISANRVITETVGNSSKVTTTFTYKGDSANLTAAELDQVSVTGTTDLTVPAAGVGVQTFSYDGNGDLTLIQPKGVSWNVQQTYDSFRRPWVQTDANGFTTTYTWDSSGRLKTITPQNFVAISISYDSDFLGATVTRGEQVTKYRYNGFGQLVLVQRTANGKNSTQVIGYYPDGRKKYETVWQPGTISDTAWTEDPTVAATTYAYNDPQFRLTDVTDPNGKVTHTTYNGLNRTVTASTPGKSGVESTKFREDALGRLVRVENTVTVAGTLKTIVTTHKYELASRIAEVKQFDGDENASRYQLRQWGYHPLGWLQSFVQPESGTTTYSQFTVGGKPQLTTYLGDGVSSGGTRTVSTSYGSLMRPLMIKSIEDASVDQEFRYDDASVKGNNKLVWDRNGAIARSLSYSSDRGLLAQLDTNLPGSRTFTQMYGYDDYGQRISATIKQFAGEGDRLVTMVPDNAKGLPKTIRYQNELVATANTDDPARPAISASWSLLNLQYASGPYTTYDYDPDQVRLKTMVHTYSGGANKGWSYKYDGPGRLTTDGEDAYQYDELGRLIQATIQGLDSSTPLTQSFTFDAFGNMASLTPGGNTTAVSAGFSFSPTDPAFLRNRLPGDSISGASYDRQGNLTAVNATSGKTPLNMSYDSLGRVTSMTNHDASSGITEVYQYTAEGLRTIIEEWSGSTFVRRRFNLYNDARQLVSQYVESPQGGVVGSGAMRGLVATKSATAKKTITRLATYKEPCEANISSPVDNITVQVGQRVMFSGTTDVGTSAKWNFGDGGTATGFNTSHVYATAGTFNVILTVTGSPTKTLPGTGGVTITVTPSVSIGSFSAAATTIPVGGSTTLTWSTTSATGVTLNGAAVAVSGNQVVSPTTSTTYTLVASNGGTSVNQAVTVTVVQAPVISGFGASPTSIYQGDGSTLSWMVSGATALSLDQGIGAVSGSSRGVSPSGTTTYTLTATNTQNGVSVNRTAQTSITVSPRPTVPSITAFSADSGTIGAGHGTTLRWNVTNSVGAVNVTLTSVGGVGASSTALVTPGTTTTYTLTATNSLDASKTVSANVTVTVIQKPVIQGFSASPANVYLGGQTTLNWNIANGPTSVSIDNGVGGVGASGSTPVTLNTNTTYTITASNLGGTTTAQVGVTVTPKPSITNYTASSYTITKGRSSTLVWNVQGADSYTINGTTVSGTSVVVAPSATTTYTLRATNGSGYMELPLTITVQDTGSLAWKKDIVYMGAKELAEFDSAGMHITLVDHLGSPRILVQPGGTVVVQQKFTPFGESLTEGNNAAQFAKGFTNHEQTDASGMIYMQARFYLPMWGRFASPDPARDQHFEQTQSWNIYSYVRNNPVMRTDPTGMLMFMNEQTWNVAKKHLEKIAVGGVLSYDKKTQLVSIKDDGTGKAGGGFKLLSNIINNKSNFTEVRINGGSELKASYIKGSKNAQLNIGLSAKPFSEVLKSGSLEKLSKSGKFSDTTQEETPIFVQVAHELVHASHVMDGSINMKTASWQIYPGRVEKDYREEYRTIGLPGFIRNGDVNENLIRTEHGLPLRVNHGGGAVVTVSD